MKILFTFVLTILGVPLEMLVDSKKLSGNQLTTHYKNGDGTMDAASLLDIQKIDLSTCPASNLLAMRN